MVRGIPLFKGTPCSMQSGLSSAGERTTESDSVLPPPGRDCPRIHVPILIIYISSGNMQAVPEIFLNYADAVQECTGNEDRGYPADRQ